MNYYERHLGDYAKDTGHLTMLEHGAYSLLLDRYYGTEQGIPADQAHRIARARSPAEKEAVDTVLAEFFTLVDGVWTKPRVEEEIAKAQKKIGAARENGKAGGRPPKPKPETQEKPGGLSLGSETETGSKALQTPDTSLQTPDTREKTKRVPALTVEALVADGLTLQTAEGWSAHRRAKGAKLTALAWAGFKAEVLKAPGWTLEAAVLKAIARNWTAFEASWVASDTPGRHQPAANADTATRNAEAARLLGFDQPPEDDRAAG